MIKKKFPIRLPKCILFCLPLLITGCIGGGVTLDSTDGSKIKFKKENVFCEKGIEYEDIFGFSGGGMRQNVECTANGVRTFLTGEKTNFSQTKLCKIVDLKGKKVSNAKAASNANTFACSAATKLGKLK